MQKLTFTAMSTPMTLLIMAAGSGSRYGKLKQFDPLGPHGEFLMEFAIYDAIAAGFNHIVIITKPDRVYFSKIPATVSFSVLPQEIKDIPIHTEIWKQRKKPWGTAHAIWAARNAISNPFIVINADDFYGAAAFLKAAHFIQNNPREDFFALIAYSLQNTLSENGTVSRGICEIKNNVLVRITEKQQLAQLHGAITDLISGEHYSGTTLVSMNFWICRPSIFVPIELEFVRFLQEEERALQEELFIPTIIQHMVTTKQIQVKNEVTHSKWFGITYEKDRLEAVRRLKVLCSNGSYPSPLWM